MAFGVATAAEGRTVAYNVQGVDEKSAYHAVLIVRRYSARAFTLPKWARNPRVHAIDGSPSPRQPAFNRRRTAVFFLPPGVHVLDCSHGWEHYDVHFFAKPGGQYVLERCVSNGVWRARVLQLARGPYWDKNVLKDIDEQVAVRGGLEGLGGERVDPRVAFTRIASALDSVPQPNKIAQTLHQHRDLLATVFEAPGAGSVVPVEDASRTVQYLFYSVSGERGISIFEWEQTLFAWFSDSDSVVELDPAEVWDLMEVLNARYVPLPRLSAEIPSE